MIVESNKMSAQCVMDYDTHLLYELRKLNEPILHLYDWRKKTITHGLFTPFNTIIHNKRGEFDCAKRPTGGGITFHIDDVSFSLFIPSSHRFFSLSTIENYKRVNSWVKDTLLQLVNNEFCEEEMFLNIASRGDGMFCSSSLSPCDIMLNTMKICGGAQRRKGWGFLHQGTIFINPLSAAEIHQVVDKEIYVHARSSFEKTHGGISSRITNLDTASLKREVRYKLRENFARKIECVV